MKATGIVRRIDDLGRVVIPKEIRRTLRIREGDPLEIFTDSDGEIILKKYSPIGELGAFAKEYAESLAQTIGHVTCIVDKDQIIAVSGGPKKDFYEKHKIINFDTLYEKRQYEVVAAFYSKVYKNEEDVFKYYNYPGKLDKKQYANYVKNCRKLSVYDTGVTPSYGEQLFTLVTCAYQTEEGRFVVVARRI